MAGVKINKSLVNLDVSNNDLGPTASDYFVNLNKSNIIELNTSSNKL